MKERGVTIMLTLLCMLSFMFMEYCWIVGVAAEGGEAFWEPKIKNIRSVPHGPSNGSSQIVYLVLTRVAHL